MLARELWEVQTRREPLAYFSRADLDAPRENLVSPQGLQLGIGQSDVPAADFEPEQEGCEPRVVYIHMLSRTHWVGDGSEVGSPRSDEGEDIDFRSPEKDGDLLAIEAPQTQGAALPGVHFPATAPFGLEGVDIPPEAYAQVYPEQDLHVGGERQMLALEAPPPPYTPGSYASPVSYGGYHREQPQSSLGGGGSCGTRQRE